MGHDAFVQKWGHARARRNATTAAWIFALTHGRKRQPTFAPTPVKKPHETKVKAASIIFSEKAPDAFTRRGVDHRGGAPLTQGAGGAVQDASPITIWAGLDTKTADQ